MSNSKGRTLFFITTSFPFGYGEVSLENEIKVLAECFDKIFIIPLYKSNDNVRVVPGNVEVLDILYSSSVTKGRVAIIKDFLLVIKVIFLEFIYTDNRIGFFMCFRKQLSSLGQCLKKAELFSKMLKQKKVADSRFYSNWMNDGALILSILKSKGVIKSFVFRQRGFDLYDDRQKNNYMPFRYFNFKNASTVCCIANDGFKYICNKNIFPEKVVLSHLGVFDNGVNPFSADIFTIVSCSSIVSLKRVDLIPDILKYLRFPVKWIHFGDGPQKKEVLDKLKALPPNVAVEIKGQVTNAQIIDFYRRHPVHLFIHLSESEGGAAVALQEAASFGIPLLGTNAGGIPDIVTNETGILIQKDFKAEEVAAQIYFMKDGKYNTIEFRSGVRDFWKSNFDANVNYKNFFGYLDKD